MKDFVKTFQKRKHLINAGIVVGAFVFALGLHISFTDTNLSQKLKASVIDTQQNKAGADISLESDGNTLIVKNRNPLQNVTDLSFSVIYNGENVLLEDYKSEYSNNIDILGDTGMKTFFISLDGTSLSSESEVIRLDFVKIEEEVEETPVVEYINIIQANFSDGTDRFELSTSGTSF